jgi:integrase
MPRLFSKDEIDALLYSALNPQYQRIGIVGKWLCTRNHLIMLMSYSLALRPLEVCSIKIKDIDLKNRVVSIPPESNKLHRGRQLPLPDHLIPLIHNYLNLTRLQYWTLTEYLFPSLQNSRISRDRWTEIFRRIRYEARIHHGTPYDLRHSKATEIYQKTNDPLLVANTLGHTDLESTKVYIHLSALQNGYMQRLRNALN